MIGGILNGGLLGILGVFFVFVTVRLSVRISRNGVFGQGRDRGRYVLFADRSLLVGVCPTSRHGWTLVCVVSLSSLTSLVPLPSKLRLDSAWLDKAHLLLPSSSFRDPPE
jgi:hypothetical protein